MWEDAVGRRLVRYEIVLFVVAAVVGRLLFGRLTVEGYARMLAWAALLSWLLAALTVVLRLVFLYVEFEPVAYRHGQHQLKEWSGFLFLAGMVPFAASALLGWIA